MERMTRLQTMVLVLAVVAAPLAAPRPAPAASAAELDQKAAAALRQLTQANPAARMLSERAKAVLVFPTMVKAGFMFGGQIGEGALRRQGRTVGYYNSVAASYGLQAGVQSFGVACPERLIEQLRGEKRTQSGKRLRGRSQQFDGCGDVGEAELGRKRLFRHRYTPFPARLKYPAAAAA
jgi:hypothetical protein